MGYGVKELTIFELKNYENLKLSYSPRSSYHMDSYALEMAWLKS